ncbi:hypothetical protein QNI16_37915 [Cytophagaceae bacterium YF14B1]|uniref:Uncharacterized protein n=1 Tax=Xanthocytophaga flava TaxID=3048013 RepID=A0AAE3UD85_9BACT|nr:hypothetical protein [Xanthocytophaga flavus]MDJ1486318.1 hypothetical protein [Xanthocytophaga flavus]
MTAKEFTEQLKAKTPDIDLLIASVGSEIAPVIIKEYTCLPKGDSYQEDTNPIFELFINYNHNISIGFIGFLQKISTINGFIHFALFQEDLVVIDKDSDEILVVIPDDLFSLEPGEYPPISFYCAQNSASFLNMFILYAEFNANELLGKRYNPQEKEFLLEELSQKAGGEKYKKFISVLLNIQTPQS